MRTLILATALVGITGMAACTPTIRVDVPDRPIEINLNINMKIEGDVRVRLADAERGIQENPDLF